MLKGCCNQRRNKKLKLKNVIITKCYVFYILVESIIFYSNMEAVRQSLLKDIYCRYRSEKRNYWCIYIIVKIPFCNKSKPRDEKIIVYIFYGLTDIFKLLINSYEFTRIVVLGYLLPVKKPFYIKNIKIRSRYFIVITRIRSI